MDITYKSYFIVPSSVYVYVVTYFSSIGDHVRDNVTMRRDTFI